jgi:hypothetical protein
MQQQTKAKKNCVTRTNPKRKPKIVVWGTYNNNNSNNYCFISSKRLFRVSQCPSLALLLGDHNRYLQCIKRSMSTAVPLLDKRLMNKDITVNK